MKLSTQHQLTLPHHLKMTRKKNKMGRKEKQEQK